MSDQGQGTNEWELARLVEAMPQVPMVTASGVAAEKSTPAALLAWGRCPAGWAAGICFVYKAFRGTLIRALVTVWIPAGQVKPRRSVDYGAVPRVVLAGPLETWPRLPPVYPDAGPEWTARHQHVVRPDPQGRYGLGIDEGARRR